ncbi:TIGR02206 family membrane protein [Arthrobacter ginkgonis]|uniref:TIGR02206 family membrane protein n=1 Tax=Arthrobacter ginkgonis TaxID=1630594 RepID=A0ABP7BRR5_9MICC
MLVEDGGMAASETGPAQRMFPGAELERMTGLTIERTFIPLGFSHWLILLLVAAGAVLLVWLGRALRGTRAEESLARGFAIVLLAYAGTMLIVRMLPARWNIDLSLPLHVSDLTWMVAVYALWTRSRWAFALTYYWGLTLNPQAMITPAVRPGFPDLAFIDFWLQHALVVWAAVYLTWGLGLRPDWAAFRTAVACTLGWAVVVFCFNVAAGTNYGFLNAKPVNPSALDLMGPWPWYLAVELVVVLALWALITWPWTRTRKTGQQNLMLGPGGQR